MKSKESAELDTVWRYLTAGNAYAALAALERIRDEYPAAWEILLAAARDDGWGED